MSVVQALEHVVLLGPPGVGKGSQARRLHGLDGLCHFSMGDALRDEISQGTERGRRIRSLIDSGCFADDETVMDLLQDRLERFRPDRGLLLDGFPRNVLQAERLERLIEGRHESLRRVVFLDAPREVIVERLSGRRVCSGCSRTYHLHFRPPRERGLCDGCGAPLLRRPDDRPDAQERRLRVYDRVTRPLVEYYDRLGLLRRIDAAAPMPQVAAALREAL